MTKEISVIKALAPFEKDLAEFKKDFENVVYNLDDPAQLTQAKKDRLSIGKVISLLDKAHKKVKEPILIKGNLIDSTRKKYKDGLLELQDGIKDQIKKHDEAVAAEAERLQGLVDYIEGLADIDINRSSSSDIQEQLDKVNAVEVDDNYDYRKADATLAQVDVIKTLGTMLDVCLVKEREQAELAQLKKEKEEREQKAREDQIAADAVAEEARKSQQTIKDAEDAKQKAITDAAAAEQRTKDAEAKAKADQKQATIDAETKRLKDIQDVKDEAKRIADEKETARLAEVQRVEQEDKTRAANTKHKGAINRGILAEIVKLGATEAVGKKIIKAIAHSKIEHISIKY
jgi:hypothetical protein